MKKIIAAVFILVFLISSISFISASDTQSDAEKTIDIPVKIIWNDSNNERPSFITVQLIKDGFVVDEKNLSTNNSWQATFKNVDADGNYKVISSSAKGYNTSTRGNAQEGFVIKNIAQKDTLSSRDISEVDATISTDNTTNNIVSDDNSTNNTNNIKEYNTTTKNKTDSNTTNINKTDTNKTTNKTNKTSPIKHDSKKIPVKQPVKKEQPKVTKTKLRHTGLPAVALVLVIIIVAFVPFTRKK